MQFLKDDKMTAQVEGFMDKLQELNIRFDLSVSIDGKYCEYGRTECDDEYYEKLKNFMVARDIRFHPMVSADNVKYWIDNYVWFRQTFPDQIAKEIMTLEVRNSDWTEESIQDLIRFCDFLIDYKFDEFNHNKEEFLKYILGIYDINRGDAGIPYNVIELNNTGVCSNVDAISCSLNNSLSIRVGDLSVAPCHRLFYPELAIGKFETDENHKIVDFNVENPGLLITKCNMKRSCLPHCERCKFNDVCVGFCCGASYEEYKNMLIPQLEVCKMYQTKITFLIFKYYSMGLFDDEIFETIRDKVSPQRYKYLKDLINSFFAGGTFGDVG